MRQMPVPKHQRLNSLDDIRIPVEAIQGVNLMEGFNSNKLKSIVDLRTDNVISVVNRSYKLVKNEEIVDPIINSLERLNVKYYLDPSHSFVSSNKMRLQLTFPELVLNDSQSPIHLSLFVHNSYDQSESIRLMWGAIRYICTNGMIVKTIIGGFYRRHTAGFSFELVKERFEQASDRILLLQNRIGILEATPAGEQIRKNVEEYFPKKIYQYVYPAETTQHLSMYEVFNLITWYISHNVQMHLRAGYQNTTSKLFGV